MILHARRKGLDVISPLSAGTKISTARRLFAAAQNGKTKPLKSPISRVTLGRPGPGGCAGTVAPWLSRSGAIPWLGAERQIVRCLSSRRIRPPSDPARPGPRAALELSSSRVRVPLLRGRPLAPARLALAAGLRPIRRLALAALASALTGLDAT